MTTKLTARSLTLIRGERTLFDDLSFGLRPGGLLLLEGQNGAGKTSLLKAIAGLLELESGELEWLGSPIRKLRDVYSSAFVWMAHKVGLKSDLTLIENLRFEAALREMSMQDLDAVIERLDLVRLKKLPLRSLSAGQQRRVALARMLLASAELWLMDEPFTNLDREGRQLVVDMLTEHLSSGGMCVLAAHQDVNIAAPTERIRLG